jgi:hypothetical protein
MIRKSDQMEIFRAYDGGEAEWLAVRAKESCEQARLILLAAAVIVALLSMPMAAQADWQYTKWGMNIEAVARASQGALRVPTMEERRAETIGSEPELIGPYRTSGFAFTSYFYFGQSGLRMVMLIAIDALQTRAIVESLRGLYGEPVEVSRVVSLVKSRWRDDRSNNSIETYDLVSSASMPIQINYKPLRSGAEKGL